MPAILDLPAVRHLTEELNARLRRCDNGEGMECNTLDAMLSYYGGLCHELQQIIRQWARAVFTTQVAFDPEVEKLLKNEVRHLLNRAKQLAAAGRGMTEKCFELLGLDQLHYYVADLDYLLENWVSPRPAVSPAPRVKVPDAAKRQISRRLAELPALPADWRPTDPMQLALFQKQQAK